ncbi:PTS sugar transporter subunit IIA [Nannocystis punicea]|uniref:PTS EIIA type-4 domain-containing protein n=1 Tax=Nannocystis punicea TaxID=2995304 RepID=A0ABY7HE59_9BACT|nr:hypothetical protein [Nannocystis poenicansa]WAS97573.1 hypothetical protein O0S08_15625 [Nannocystis poenicansa]
MPEAVGIVLVGHGRSASALLEAARGVCGEAGLVDVVAIDAGRGETDDLKSRLKAALKAVDRGRGVLMIADAYGASPCSCGIREATAPPVVLSGLSFNILLKLASLDRTALSPEELARACADSAKRALAVHVPAPAPAKESTA